MPTKEEIQRRIAVCSWSLEPKNPADLIEKLSATGINQIQLALDPLRNSTGPWKDAPSLLAQSKITIVSGMFGCVGEDYSTLETIRRTGGLTPDATWDENVRNIKDCAKIAEQLGLKLVTFHAGFVPPDKSYPAHAKLLKRLDVVATIFADRNIGLGLETGQETAEELASFLTELNRPNVGVNFDPANLILYDKSNPVTAAGVLAPWLRQIHVKDARRTRVPGTWGTEVLVGTGEVNWPALLRALDDAHFTGNLSIEREAGDNRLTDIRAARDLLLMYLQFSSPKSK